MNAKAFNRYLGELKFSETAFRKIYEYYLPKIKYHVISKYGRQVDFEDVAHDLFTRLIRMQNLPEVENPTAWIYAICDNICNDELRKRRFSLPLDEQIALEKESAITAEGDCGFFAVLEHLSEEEASIIRLVIWEGYNLKETGKMLGITYGATRQKYSRALKKLKQFV